MNAVLRVYELIDNNCVVEKDLCSEIDTGTDDDHDMVMIGAISLYLVLKII